MNSQHTPASKPKPMGTHNFLNGFMDRMPKDPVGARGDMAALNEAHQVSATPGTSQQEQMGKMQMNAHNTQMALPQNKAAQMPALEVDVPTPSLSKGHEFLRKAVSNPGLYTKEENAAIDQMALASRLPVR